MKLIHSSNFDALLFDLDGTLVDSSEAHGVAYQMAFHEVGIEISSSSFKDFEGLHHLEVIKGLAGSAAKVFDPALLHQRKTEILSTVAPLHARSTPLLKMLPFLVGELSCGLVTSATKTTAESLFCHLGDLRKFACVITAEDVTHHKPHPEPYLLACSRLGIMPSRCLVFEDSDSGVLSAREAGCTVIRVSF